MSRYDRYSTSALEVLHTVQDIVRREGRDESTLPDLARAVLLSAVPDVLGIARLNDRSLDRERLKALHEAIFSLPLPEGKGAIRLSPEFRSALDRAERISSGEPVRPEHLIHAAWEGIKDEIAPYLSEKAASPEGAPKTAPGPRKGTNKSIIDPEASIFGAEPKRESQEDGPALQAGALSPEEIDALMAEINAAARSAGLSPDRPSPEPAGPFPTRTDGPAAPSGELRLPALSVSPEREASLEFLATLGRELTAPGEPYEVLGRDAEIDSLVTVLLRSYKPNPLVIGESGVGKTALVEGLAQRIREGKVPEPLKGSRIFEIRLSDLAAGTGAHGAMEERLRSLVMAAEACPEAIVFFDELHQAAQSYGNEPTADVLKPALSRGAFRCIGAATLSDYHRHLERDGAFLRRFQTLFLQEPDPVSLRSIMDGAAARLAGHFRLEVPPEAVAASIDASSRLLSGRSFPDKSLDALDRACARAFMLGEASVSAGRVREAAAAMAAQGSRASGAEEAAEAGVEGLEARIRRDIVGQDAAVDKVCSIVRVCKKRLDLRPERPDGAFLFTGPTGVGKTALAESLALRLTGRRDQLFRIDMSEFSESHTIARLLGAPPGYVGYGDMALLGQAAEKIPTGVLLLDEFEKAHPQIHRLFLQILDSGRTTDSFGKILSFSDMTIIATCNVNDDASSRIGFGAGTGGLPSLPLSRLKQVFPPELLNRFDALVPFSPLSRQQCRSILADILVEKSNSNLRKEYGFELSLDPLLIEKILDEGYSAEFGARNLQRAYEALLILPLSERIESFRGVTALVRAFTDEAGAILFEKDSGAT